ncbi:MAG: hypothetical protein ACKVOT_13845 [Polaromonas sp.]
MSEFVVWFDSSETGAPVLNNAAGSLIGVLDACLVTGFNPKTLTSLTVSGGVATATLNGHGYSGTYSKDVLVAGATPALLNGRKQLTAVTANTFTYPAPGVADGPATGTITTKRDSLGWIKEFAGTNKAIYKRSDVTATTMKLRIVDNNTDRTEARALLVEAASDIDTFTDQKPGAIDISDGNGQYWNKGQNSSSSKQWSLIGTSKGFYLFTQSGEITYPFLSGSGYTSLPMAFFDFASLKPGDAYNTILSGGSSASGGTGTVYSSTGIGGGNPSLTPGNPASFALARPYSQLSGRTPIATIAPVAGAGFSGGYTNLPFPSPVDSGFLMSISTPLIETLSTGYAFRGFLPGYIHFISNSPIAHHQIFSNVGALPGRQIMGVQPYVQGLANFGLDLTGPWY